MNTLECSNCGHINPIMEGPRFVRGPMTPTEELTHRAAQWTPGSRFSHAEPVAADLIGDLLDTLDPDWRTK